MTAAADTAKANGKAPAVASDEFPLENFRDAARHLRRPFTVEAVKFKPQSVTKTGKTICVAYIDARLVVERLNLILPHLWHDEYEPLGGKHLICRLTVDGITRQDIGEGAGKALYSDALKRAAVKFGIGVSLYAVPSMMLPGKVEYLYPDSAEYRKLRDHYARWLDGHGRQAFGDPLDHGDAEDAQGDTDADAPDGVDGVDLSTGEIAALPEERVAQLEAIAAQLFDANVLTGSTLKARLVAAGATTTDTVAAALGSLTAAQADEFESTMADLKAAADAKAAA